VFTSSCLFLKNFFVGWCVCRGVSEHEHEHIYDIYDLYDIYDIDALYDIDDVSDLYVCC
jgi:hypothetical protein